jgi:hypothetical protein
MAVVHRLQEEGEAVVANKGGVREEGVVGHLLAMARWPGEARPGREGRRHSAVSSGKKMTGGARTSAREGRGKAGWAS